MRTHDPIFRTFLSGAVALIEKPVKDAIKDDGFKDWLYDELLEYYFKVDKKTGELASKDGRPVKSIGRSSHLQVKVPEDVCRETCRGIIICRTVKGKIEIWRHY